MSEKPYTFDSSRYKREVPPPASIEVGSSPPHFSETAPPSSIGIYIDFDNLYGAFLDLFNISVEKRPNQAQKLLFPKVLSSFLRGFRWDNVRYIKAFAEFENLPHANPIFDGRLPVFLHNNGVVPHSPFIISGTSKKKNKNAADISLVLHVVEDVVIKKIALERIIVVSGDGDFYPLIQWIKENVGKEIYIAFFQERLNKIYFDLMFMWNHKYRTLKSPGKKTEIILLNDGFYNSIINTLDWILKEFPNFFDVAINDQESIEWFRSFLKKIEHIDDGKLIIQQIEGKMGSFKMQKQEEALDDILCQEFREKLVDNLIRALERYPYVSTGLIIKHWLYDWNLYIDVVEANMCLRKIIEKGLLEKYGIHFHMEIDSPVYVRGYFYKQEEDNE